MPIFAQIADGVVVNTSPFDGPAPADWVSLAGTSPQPGIGWSYKNNSFAAPVSTFPVSDLASDLMTAASGACSAITAQVIPDPTHQLSYTNAATIVWASGGGAPTAEPAKTIFAQQALASGIADPAIFAKVVTAVSLGSMQLATILGSLREAARNAQSPNDLGAALSAFEATLNGFVSQLNAAGLTVTVAAPPAIVISGINA